MLWRTFSQTILYTPKTVLLSEGILLRKNKKNLPSEHDKICVLFAKLGDDTKIFFVYLTPQSLNYMEQKIQPSKICGRQPLKNLKGYGLL